MKTNLHGHLHKTILSQVDLGDHADDIIEGYKSNFMSEKTEVHVCSWRERHLVDGLVDGLDVFMDASWQKVGQLEMQKSQF